MNYKMIQVKQDQKGFAHVVLNRPEKKNSLNAAMIGEISHALNEARENDAIRGIVLTGEGDCFSAGGDLDWMKGMIDATYQENLEDAKALADMLYNLYSFPKPSIAKVQGSAYGGGVGLISCCDIAYAVSKAKFKFSEVRLGLIPATIAPYIVKCIGERNTRELFITARTINAVRAKDMSLITDYVDEKELNKTVTSCIDKITSGGKHAILESKALISLIASSKLDRKLVDDTSKMIASIRIGDEAQGRLKTFFEATVA